VKKKAILPLMLITALAVVGFFRCPPTQTPTLKGGRSDNKQWASLLDYLGHHGTSGALLVEDHHQIKEEHFWTWESNQMDSGTLFNIGSVSKQFTGFLALQILSEAKMRESQSVSEILEETAGTEVGSLKIYDLLAMTSGLPHDEWPLTKVKAQLFNFKWRSPEILAELKKYRPEGEVGSKFHYSNLNYILLAQIIAKVENQPFARVLQERIFAPFKMNHTFLDTYGEGNDRLARGHVRFLGRWLPMPNWNYSFLQGAGGIVSNVGDLQKWLSGLSDFFGQHPELVDQYFGYSSRFHYGFGWSTLRGLAAHSGETPGFCAYIVTTKDLMKSAILTLNSDDCISGDFEEEVIVRINAGILSEQ
jgi:CubicO group peptidase (beta-lactamase class C family)